MSSTRDPSNSSDAMRCSMVQSHCIWTILVASIPNLAQVTDRTRDCGEARLCSWGHRAREPCIPPCGPNPNSIGITPYPASTSDRSRRHASCPYSNEDDLWELEHEPEQAPRTLRRCSPPLRLIRGLARLTKVSWTIVLSPILLLRSAVHLQAWLGIFSNTIGRPR